MLQSDLYRFATTVPILFGYIIFGYSNSCCCTSNVKRYMLLRCMYNRYVCMVIAHNRLGNNRDGCQSCSCLAVKGKCFFLSTFAPEKLVSRDRFVRPSHTYVRSDLQSFELTSNAA